MSENWDTVARGTVGLTLFTFDTVAHELDRQICVGVARVLFMQVTVSREKLFIPMFGRQIDLNIRVRTRVVTFG
jgi:hypothetical protein